MKSKTIIQTLVLFFFVLVASAQQGINYKAIINDAKGDALVTTPVIIQFTILENGTTNVYQETHNPTTDANGIIIVNIGEGTVLSGDFNAIDWGSSPHSLKTEINTGSGSGLTDMGTTTFKSVPYAIHVETANKAILDEVDDADADPENELQTLTILGNTLSLSNGGGDIELPSGTAINGQYYFADKDRDGFGYMYEPIWVLDGVEPPAFYVNNSNDCNDNDFYTQDGSTEQCDGIDNDCDGEIDEDWPLLGEPCTSGEGACLRYGFYVCNESDPTGPVICNAIPGIPQDEIDCNYLDDDCNGIIDDGFVDENGIYNSDVACGNCYTNCMEIYNVPNAYGRCNTSGSGPLCEMLCDEGYFDLDGNPQNGCEFFIDENAVYVSPIGHGGDDTGDCGNYDSPCSSITHGISRAVSLGRNRVLVANGIYEESVNLTDGISLHGGFDPVTWIQAVENTNSIITGVHNVDNHVATVIVENITKETTISGFQIHGTINNNTSGNSYVIYVTNSTGNLIITNNIIWGGIAGYGSDGQNGENGFNGFSGSNGQDAFEDYSPLGEFICNEQDGGAGGIFSYNSSVLSGGFGGMTSCPIEYGNVAGSGGTGTASGSLPGGIGGTGGYHAFVQVFNCNGYQVEGPISGQDGSNGLDGINGAGGSGGNGTNGTIITSHWHGQAGFDGLKGGDGSSGGGGGAGGSLLLHSSCFVVWQTNLIYAPTGGGGGSGAQGGFGGLGGKPGGASIGITVIDGIAPIIENNIFRLGIGGKGGNGGTGGFKGIGAKGGSGGNIGTEILDGILKPGLAGSGGRGGDGGMGGGGGGGAGGCVFGIYTSNISGVVPGYESINVFNGGTAGKGGTGGYIYGNPGDNGVDGIVENSSHH